MPIAAQCLSAYAGLRHCAFLLLPVLAATTAAPPNPSLPPSHASPPTPPFKFKSDCSFFGIKPLTPLQKAKLEVQGAVNKIVARSRDTSPLARATFDDVAASLPKRDPADPNAPPYERLISQMVSTRLQHELEGSQSRALELEKRVMNAEGELARVQAHYTSKQAALATKQAKKQFNKQARDWTR